jgi:hypothetical protein
MHANLSAAVSPGIFYLQLSCKVRTASSPQP